MIAPMTKYSFILLKGDQEGLLEKLQEIGLVDITRSVKPIDDKSAAILADAERKHALLQSLDKVEIPEGLAHTAVSGDPEEAAKAALDHLAELEEALKAAEKEAAASEPWGEYDRDKLRAVEDAGIPVHFHITPAKAFKAEWADQYALSVVNELDGKVYYVVAGEDPLPDALKRGPKASATDIQARIATLQANIDREKAVLAGVKDVRGKIENAARRNLSDLDLYLASQAAVPAAENTLVTLVGYAPAEDEEAVTKALDATGEYYFKDAAVVEDNPPISFRNNKFVRMFEVLTDMYGRPAYNGFDPTPFIAVFFLLFFAFCMGDAGYGLILIVIGLLLKKVDSFKDYAPLVVTLGIGTTVIGFLFHTFFSMDIAQWSIFKGFPFLPSMETCFVFIQEYSESEQTYPTPQSGKKWIRLHHPSFLPIGRVIIIRLLWTLAQQFVYRVRQIATDVLSALCAMPFPSVTHRIFL